ncbi:MAG TPA: hypothetical protein V6C65_04365 [Allocoleopsis sp.]
MFILDVQNTEFRRRDDKPVETRSLSQSVVRGAKRGALISATIGAGLGGYAGYKFGKKALESKLGGMLSPSLRQKVVGGSVLIGASGRAVKSIPRGIVTGAALGAAGYGVTRLRARMQASPSRKRRRRR